MAILLLSSTLIDAPLFRLRLEPTQENGLRQPCQIRVDKVVTVRRDKIGGAIGRLNHSAMLAVNRSLALHLGFS